MSISQGQGERMSDDKRRVIDEYFIKIKKELTTDEGLEAFKNRLQNYWMVMADFSDPIDFNIFADAFMCFFPIDEVESELYLEGGMSDKYDLMYKKKEAKEYLGFDEMVNRCLGFADILFHTGGRLRQPIYIQAANRMLYVLTGTNAVLDQIGNCLYVFPDYENRESSDVEDVLIPEDEHEGVLYQ
jgi:hypothetical protein